MYMKNKKSKWSATKFISDSGLTPKSIYLNNIQRDNNTITKKGKWILSKPTCENLILFKLRFGLMKPDGNIEFKKIAPIKRIEVSNEILGTIEGITNVLKLIDKRKTKELKINNILVIFP